MHEWGFPVPSEENMCFRCGAISIKPNPDPDELVDEYGFVMRFHIFMAPKYTCDEYSILVILDA